MQKLKELLVKMSVLYGRPMERGTLELYLQVLGSNDPEKLYSACLSLMNDPKQRTMPLPAEIIAKANPKVDSDAEAREAASRLVAAVSKYGYTNPEAAENYIGELGWRVVQRWGGWQYICENLGATIDVTTFQAQVRDVAKATLTRAGYGMDNLPPAISSSPAMQKLLNSNDLNRALLEKGGTHGN